jgi:glycosyltransferase involved in cell wall biosynthesis
MTEKKENNILISPITSIPTVQSISNVPSASSVSSTPSIQNIPSHNTPLHILVLTPDRPFKGMGGLSVQVKEMVEGTIRHDKNIRFSIIGPELPLNKTYGKEWFVAHDFKPLSDDILEKYPLHYYNSYQKSRMIGNNNTDISHVLSEESYYIITANLYNIIPDIIVGFDFSTCNAGWILKDYYDMKYQKQVPYIFGCSLSYGKWYEDISVYYKYPIQPIVEFVKSKEQRSAILCDAMFCNSHWYLGYLPPFKPVYTILNGVNLSHVETIRPMDNIEIQKLVNTHKNSSRRVNEEDKNIKENPSSVVTQPNKPFRVLYMGRFVTNKGVQFLMSIKDLPENCEIYFMGDSSGATVHLFDQLLQLVKFKTNMHYVGRLDGDQKFSFIKSMDLCIFPSIHEPFGIVMLEAAACRVPFMYSDIPGMGEIGRIVGGIPLKLKEHTPAQMPEYIKSEIEKVMKWSEEDKTKIIQHAVKQIQYFNWDDIAHQYIKMFREVWTVHKNQLQLQHKSTSTSTST